MNSQVINVPYSCVSTSVCCCSKAENKKMSFPKSGQAAAGHLNSGKNDHYSLKLLLQSQYLSHLQNWKSKLKDRNEKRLRSSHSKFDVKQYQIELAHKYAILIEKESYVQFHQAPPFLIFFSPSSSKVKYCFLAEIIKKTSESHEYFAICSCKFKSDFCQGGWSWNKLKK